MILYKGKTRDIRYIEERKCIISCYEQNLYEENDRCYSYVPEGYYSDNNMKLYKCNNKCKICTLESTANDLCISCNNLMNYYPKLNDESNHNSFINCYNNIPEKYYLYRIEKIFKPITVITYQVNDGK